jgi:hypothetical protein
MNVMNFALANAMGRRYETVDDDQRQRASLIAMFMPSPALGLIGAKTVLDNAEEEISDQVAAKVATVADERAAAAEKAREDAQDKAVETANRAASLAIEAADAAAVSASGLETAQHEIRAEIVTLTERLNQIDQLLRETGKIPSINSKPQKA